MQGYVTGVGKTRFGPTSHSMVRLAQSAMRDALEDAMLTPDDLGCIIVSNFLGGPNDSQLHLNSVIMGAIPGVLLPGWRTEAACASGGVAVHQALMAARQYGPVLVVGVERMTGVVSTDLTRNIGMAGDAALDQARGLNFPASYALVAQEHMAAYGTTSRDLELVSLKNHANANHNPKAHFHAKKVTQADIDGGAMVAAPLRLFDCCPVSDGAAAVVVTAERRSPRDVPILASAVMTDAISLMQRATTTSFPAASSAASAAYEQAGVGPEDVSFAQVHDCFTIAEIIAYEDLGFADRGFGSRLVREGTTFLEGSLPVNTDGGLKAGGHAIGATGVSQIIEAVTQLRGEAGSRQVPDPRIALTHNVGGVGGTCAVHILGGL